MTTVQERARKARVKQSAEIFTPPKLVNQMLDKLPDEVWCVGKTFCDPACGNGNMLIEVLRRKLDKGHDPLQALKTLYGVDIIDSNVRECRLRLLKVIQDRGHAITREMLAELFNNIVVTRLGPKYPNGALDYHFGFHRKISTTNSKLDLWMKAIAEKNLLGRFQAENFNDIIGEANESEEDAQRDDPADTLFGAYQ